MKKLHTDNILQYKRQHFTMQNAVFRIAKHRIS